MVRPIAKSVLAKAKSMYFLWGKEDQMILFLLPDDLFLIYPVTTNAKFKGPSITQYAQKGAVVWWYQFILIPVNYFNCFNSYLNTMRSICISAWLLWSLRISWPSNKKVANQKSKSPSVPHLKTGINAHSVNDQYLKRGWKTSKLQLIEDIVTDFKLLLRLRVGKVKNHVTIGEFSW